MNQPIPRPRHRPWHSWTATPGTTVTASLPPRETYTYGDAHDPDERDGMTLEEMEQAAETERVPLMQPNEQEDDHDG